MSKEPNAAQARLVIGATLVAVLGGIVVGVAIWHEQSQGGRDSRERRSDAHFSNPPENRAWTTLDPEPRDGTASSRRPNDTLPSDNSSPDQPDTPEQPPADIAALVALSSEAASSVLRGSAEVTVPDTALPADEARALLDSIREVIGEHPNDAPARMAAHFDRGGAMIRAHIAGLIAGAEPAALFATLVAALRGVTDPLLCGLIGTALADGAFKVDLNTERKLWSVFDRGFSKEFELTTELRLDLELAFGIASSDLEVVRAFYAECAGGYGYQQFVYRVGLLPAHVRGIAAAARDEIDVTSLPLLEELYCALSAPMQHQRALHLAVAELKPVVADAITRLGGMVPGPLDALAYALNTGDPVTVGNSGRLFGRWARESADSLHHALVTGERLLATLDAELAPIAASGFGKSLGGNWRQRDDLDQRDLLQQIEWLIHQHLGTSSAVLKLYYAGAICNLTPLIEAADAYDNVRELLAAEYPGPFRTPHSEGPDWAKLWVTSLTAALANTDRVRAFADTLILADTNAEPVTSSAVSGLVVGCNAATLRTHERQPAREWASAMAGHAHAARFSGQAWTTIMAFAELAQAVELIDIVEPVVAHIEDSYAREKVEESLQRLRALRD